MQSLIRRRLYSRLRSCLYKNREYSGIKAGRSKQLPAGVLLWRRSSGRICIPSSLSFCDEGRESQLSAYTKFLTICAVDCGLNEGKRCLERDLDEVDVQQSFSASRACRWGTNTFSVILLEAERSFPRIRRDPVIVGPPGEIFSDSRA